MDLKSALILGGCYLTGSIIIASYPGGGTTSHQEFKADVNRRLGTLFDFVGKTHVLGSNYQQDKKIIYVDCFDGKFFYNNKEKCTKTLDSLSTSLTHN